MKKIVLASAAMGGAALLAFGASGTFAAFSDQTSVNNSAGAGTLFLTSSTPSSTSETDSVSLVPGEQASFAYFVANGGNTPGRLAFQFGYSDNDEHICLAPEARDGDTCDAQGTGEMATKSFVYMEVIPGVTEAADCDLSYPRSYEGARTVGTPEEQRAAGRRSIATTRIPSIDPVLDGGEGMCIVVDVKLNPDTTNVVQSDSIVIDTTFYLDQATS